MSKKYNSVNDIKNEMIETSEPMLDTESMIKYMHKNISVNDISFDIVNDFNLLLNNNNLNNIICTDSIKISSSGLCYNEIKPIKSTIVLCKTPNDENLMTFEPIDPYNENSEYRILIRTRNIDDLFKEFDEMKQRIEQLEKILSNTICI